jgi:hypothetical protein
MPKFFDGLGMHRWAIFVALAIVLVAAGDTLARIIGTVFLIVFVLPVAVRLVLRFAKPS